MDTFTIERDGREYTVTTRPDEMPQNPRTEYDHSATQFYVTQYTYSRWDVFVDELDGGAGNALRHFIERYRQAGLPDWGAKVERAFRLWAVITGSPVVLVTGDGKGYSQSHWHLWFALVDTDVMRREGYNATPEEVANAEADEYAAYAYGDVFGVEVESSHGGAGPVWGVIDRSGEYIREVANELIDEIESDHAERIADMQRQANLVGAGFVGVI